MINKHLISSIKYIIKKLEYIQYKLTPLPDTSWKDNPLYTEPEHTFILDSVKNWHHHQCKRCKRDGAPHRVLDLDKFYYIEFHSPQCMYCDRIDACLPKKSMFDN